MLGQTDTAFWRVCALWLWSREKPVKSGANLASTRTTQHACCRDFQKGCKASWLEGSRRVRPLHRAARREGVSLTFGRFWDVARTSRTRPNGL
jgi:hypothetical protein